MTVSFLQHSAVVYSEQSEAVSVLKNYFTEARNENRQIVFVVTNEQRVFFADALNASGFPMDQATREGWLALVEPESFYLSDGFFDVEKVYAKIRLATERALHQGFRGLAAAGLTDWVQQYHVSSLAFAEYELGVHAIMAEVPAFQGLCLYSKAIFSKSDITLQCLCHPCVVTQTDVVVNPLMTFISVNNASAFDHHEAQRYLKLLTLKWGAWDSLWGRHAELAQKVFQDMKLALFESLDLEVGQLIPEPVMQKMDWLSSRIDDLKFSQLYRSR